MLVFLHLIRGLFQMLFILEIRINERQQYLINNETVGVVAT